MTLFAFSLSDGAGERQKSQESRLPPLRKQKPGQSNTEFHPSQKIKTKNAFLAFLNNGEKTDEMEGNRGTEQGSLVADFANSI